MVVNIAGIIEAKQNVELFRMGNKAVFFIIVILHLKKAHVFVRRRWHFNAQEMYGLVHGHEIHFPNTVCPLSVQR